MEIKEIIELTKQYIVHCKKDKYDIYVGRPSKFGNKFKLEKEEDREKILKQYTKWLSEQSKEYHDMIKTELKGKVLGCWCAPKPCHGMILALIANDLL